VRLTGPYFDRRTRSWTLIVSHGNNHHLVDNFSYRDEQHAQEGRARLMETEDIRGERRRVDVVQK
jgi:hypothetical protein